MSTKRRIIRADQYNWSIQEFQEGGEVIERGRFAGQTTVAKWKNPEKHYPTLADAARAMFGEEVADGWTGEKLIQHLEFRENRILEYLNNLFQAQKDDLLIGILQERGYTVTSGKKGRSSYVEDESSDAGADSDSSPVAS